MGSDSVHMEKIYLPHFLNSQRGQVFYLSLTTITAPIDDYHFKVKRTERNWNF